MPATSVLVAAPLPPIARPARWPYAIAAVAFVAVPLTRRFDAVGCLGGGAVLAAFFLGRRSRRLWVGLAAALAVLAAWLVWPPGLIAAVTDFLALAGVCGTLCFADDPAPAGGLVTGAVLASFAQVGRVHPLGALAGALLLLWRVRPWWRSWPPAVGAILAWLVGRWLAGR